MSAALKNRLLRIMTQEMSSLRFQPTSHCEGQIRKLVGHGVTRMRINNAVDNPGQTIRAEQNLRALVKYFSNYAESVGTFPTLSDSAFENALKDCPSFWPFRC
jgi:hypothetical protein